MNDERLQTIEQVTRCIEGNKSLDFRGVSVEERYKWIQTVLVRFNYYQLKRAEKGVIRLPAAGRAVYRKNERVFPSAGNEADTSIYAKRAVKKGALHKAQISQEI
jgi:hypothetical protein